MGVKSILLIILTIVSIGILLRVLLLDNFPDFNIYYVGAKLFLKRIDPYTAEVLRVPFLYPPHTLLLFVPFTYLSLFHASITWLILNLILFFGSLYLILQIYQIKLLSNTSLFFILVSSVFFPVKFTLGMGQINIFLFFFLMLFIYWYKSKKFVPASFALGVTILLKLVPVLILPYFLIKRKVKFLFSVITFILFSTGIIIILVDKQILYTYIRFVLPELFVSPWKGDYYNQAISGFLTRHVADIDLRTSLKTFLSIFLAGITYFVLWRNRIQKNDLLGFSVLITLSLLISSFSWQHHFVWLLFPFISVFLEIGKNKSPLFYILLFLSYILTAINIKNPITIPLLLQSHVLYGTLLLWLLHLYLLEKNHD